jgi:hypothetical protein
MNRPGVSRLVEISFLKNREFGQQKAFERVVSKPKSSKLCIPRHPATQSMEMRPPNP